MRYGAIHGASPAAARAGRKQWVVLGMLTLFTTGSHYARHSLSGLGPALMGTLGVQRTGFGLLFAGENAPGIVLPALGGLLLLYVPLARTAVVLAAALLLSTALCAFAVDVRRYWVLALGRTLFGAAEGLMATVQGALIARTFRGGRVSAAFGAMLFVSRTSSFGGLSAPAWLLATYGLSAAMWTSAAVLLLPLAATIAHLVLVSDDGFRADRPTGAELASSAAASLRALRQLTPPFWAAAYTFMTVAASTFTFVHFAPDAFNGRVPGISSGQASLLSAVLFFVAGLASPGVGVLADRVGRRPAMLVTASACSTAGLLVCAATVAWPALGAALAVLGVLFLMVSLCVAPVLLLACVAIVVPASTLPLALGAYKSLENAGLAVVHVVVGRLRDVSGNYAGPMVFLAALASTAIPVLVAMGNMAPQTREPVSTSKIPPLDDDA